MTDTPQQQAKTPDLLADGNAGGTGEVFVPRLTPQRRKRPRPRPRMQLVLTPMIDVTFQLLLFFILTMQFRPSEGQIPADLPPGPAAAALAPLEPVRVILRAGADGRVDIEVGRYAGAVNGFAALNEVLRGLRASFGSPDVPVVIEPGPGVAWQHALDALRQAQTAGFKDIAFAVSERK